MICWLCKTLVGGDVCAKCYVPQGEVVEKEEEIPGTGEAVVQMADGKRYWVSFANWRRVELEEIDESYKLGG